MDSDYEPGDAVDEDLYEEIVDLDPNQSLDALLYCFFNSVIEGKENVFIQLLNKFGPNIHATINRSDVKDKNVHQALKDYGSILHETIHYRRDKLCMIMVEKGADVNFIDEMGFNAILLASERNNLPLMKFLLEHHANLHCTDNKGCTAIHYAARLASSEMIQFCYNNGLGVNVADKKGNTPLIEAIRRKSFQCAELLLQLGADANQGDENGITPLHYACERDLLLFVEILSRFDAFPFKVDKWNRRPSSCSTDSRIHCFIEKACHAYSGSIIETEKAIEEAQLGNYLSVDIRRLAICFEEMMISEDVNNLRLDYTAAVLTEDWDKVYTAAEKLQECIIKHNSCRTLYSYPEFIGKINLSLDTVQKKMQEWASSAIQNHELIIQVKGCISIIRKLRHYLTVLSNIHH